MFRSVAASGALLFHTSFALAEGSREADELFAVAVVHMKAREFERACPLLAKSQALDPTAGGLFTLAECWAGAGRSATAVAHYKQYLALFDGMTPRKQQSQRGRDEVSRRRLLELRSSVPQLRLMVGETAGAAHFKVILDGVTLGSALLGQPLPIDPGEHKVVISAPGRPASQQSFRIAAGEHKTVELTVAQAAAPVQSAPVQPDRAQVGRAQVGPPPLARPRSLPAGVTAGSGTSSSPPTAPAPPSDAVAGPSNTWAYTSLAAGVAGITLGVIAAIQAGSERSDTRELGCTNSGDTWQCPNEVQAVALKTSLQNAERWTALAIAGTGVGVLGLGLGGTLLLTGGHDDGSHALAGACLTWRGQW